MYILQTSASATGAWFRVEYGGDFTFTQLDADSLGGGTLYIDVADGAQRVIEPDAALDFTAVMTPQVVKLSRGMHVRARLAGATAPDVNVAAWSVEHAGGPALVEV